jgi:hypothetical protein
MTQPLTVRLDVVVGVLALVALVLCTVLWWIPELVVDDARFAPGTSEAAAALEEQRLKARHEARMAAAQTCFFLAVLVGGVATFRTVAQTRVGQISDRFAKAVEHLGDKGANVRVGAIYALGRVAHDSAQDHPAIMALLGDHLREVCAAPDEDAARTAPAAEVRAVALVLRRRRVDFDVAEVPIDLSGIDLRSVPLSGVDLRGVLFDGSNLRGADLQGADLSGASFVNANLTSAWLQGARFTRARLAGALLDSAHLDRTDLRTADLRGVTLSESATRAALLPPDWPTA